MKVRRMCGGGVRKEPLTGVRWSAQTAAGRPAYVAAINDRLGLALVLHDPDNAWPARDARVRRNARRAAGRALLAELDLRASLVICGLRGHDPDPMDPWCCARCGCASGSD